MAVPLNSVFEVQFKYSVNEQTCRNVIHYRNDTALADPITAFEVAAALLDEVNNANAGSGRSALLAALAGNVTLTGISVQPVYPVRWRPVKAALALAGENTTGQCEAQNVQLSISKFGAFSDRKEAGGVRIGGLPQTAYDNGRLAALFSDEMDAIALAWFTQIALTVGAVNFNVFPCIANRGTVIVGGQPVIRITGSTPVESVAVQNTLRTQRSRTIGKGE